MLQVEKFENCLVIYMCLNTGYTVNEWPQETRPTTNSSYDASTNCKPRIHALGSRCGDGGWTHGSERQVAAPTLYVCGHGRVVVVVADALHADVEWDRLRAALVLLSPAPHPVQSHTW